MLVVQVLNSDCLRVIHYTMNREGKGSLAWSPGPSQNVAMGTGAVASASLGSPFTLGEIREEIYPINLLVDNIELLEYVDDIVKHTGWNAVLRARQRLGETSYNLYSNNCESYVNWVILDQQQSDQGDKAAAGTVAAGVVLSVAVIGAILTGVSAVFSGKNKKSN